MQLRSQISSSNNIDLKDTWFTPDLEEDPTKTPINDPIITPDNKNQPEYGLHIQEIMASEGGLNDCREVHDKSDITDRAGTAAAASASAASTSSSQENPAKALAVSWVYFSYSSSTIFEGSTTTVVTSPANIFDL